MSVVKLFWGGAGYRWWRGYTWPHVHGTHELGTGVGSGAGGLNPLLYPAPDNSYTDTHMCGRLTYVIMGRSNATAILASWIHVSCGPMYALMLPRVSSTVRLILCSSLP